MLKHEPLSSSTAREEPAHNVLRELTWISFLPCKVKQDKIVLNPRLVGTLQSAQ